MNTRSIPRSLFTFLLLYAWGNDASAQPDWGLSVGPEYGAVALYSREFHEMQYASPTANAYGGTLGIWFRSSDPEVGHLSFRSGMNLVFLACERKVDLEDDDWTDHVELASLELPLALEINASKHVAVITSLDLAVPIYYSSVVQGVRTTHYVNPNETIENEHYKIDTRSTYLVKKMIVGLTFGLRYRVSDKISLSTGLTAPLSDTERFVYYRQDQGDDRVTTQSRIWQVRLMVAYTLGGMHPQAPQGQNAPQ